MSSDRWKERRRAQEAHASDVHFRAWKAGLGDQHEDAIARAFDNDVSPERFVRERVQVREDALRAERERQEEQARIESTCAHQDAGGECWGPVECVGYDGPGTYAAVVYACRGHALVHSEGVYLTVDEERIEWAEVAT